MSTINRFLSRKEKHTHHNHGKKEPKNPEGPFNGLFTDDETRGSPSKEEENKIKILSQRLAGAGIRSFKDTDISYVLRGEYAKGDADQAYELLAILQDSEEGIIQPYNPNIKLLGAVNRQGVTCYLDALLFAMFARLGSFEAMLYKSFEDPPRKRLATLLRLWVNVLRAGKLITVDITKQIQLQLANCGWEEAAKLCQQDASEAFTFITGVLDLPLLTLKMDIFHTGREDASDDHKFINERLLELAIPDEPQDGHTITVEECLEMFFNNKIEVKRYLDQLERRTTLSSIRSRGSLDSAKARSTHVEIAEVEEGQPSTPLPTSPMRPSAPLSSPSKASTRRRAPSIIQETYVDEKGAGLEGQSEILDEKRSHQRRIRKEVMMPAWQFFSLIPWYTNNVPSNDAQVAAHFSSARPILGICLKRYYMLPNGKPAKRSTHIDIPLEIGLPHFIQDDDMSDDGPAFGHFKLSLQSVVCHQGISVESGHYISLVRNPDPKNEGNDRWMRFDDLASERVIDIDAESFLKESNQQTPYLLFYQVMPIEVTPPESAAIHEPPPTYAESLESKDSKLELTLSNNQDNANYSVNGSNRPSLDLPSSEDARRGRRSLNGDRPGGTVTAMGSAINGFQLDIQPPPGIPSESSFTSKEEPASSATSLGPNSLNVDRRGSRSSKGSAKSSGTSQSEDKSEKRMSASLSRLASKISRDRSTKDKYSHSNTSNPSTGPNSMTSSPAPPSLPFVPPSSLPTDPAQQNLPPPFQSISNTNLTSSNGLKNPFAPSASINKLTQSEPQLSQPQQTAASSSDRTRLSKKDANSNDRSRRDQERDRDKDKDNQSSFTNSIAGMSLASAGGGGGIKLAHHHHQHHLTKSAGGGGSKPDRECLIM